MEQDPRAPTADDPPDFPMELESSIEDPALQNTDLQPEGETMLQLIEKDTQHCIETSSLIVLATLSSFREGNSWTDTNLNGTPNSRHVSKRAGRGGPAWSGPRRVGGGVRCGPRR
ncbi:hypothetical protein Pcinc_040590 [Petrolisthes cinctipes]|uniref:Uncharacterized protein n=1 Tax=Petrolisthes cinctipes TaxID=88211 RepID=A0AAE1EHV7_PETCI|nr:hypothetical protein Pcinc_040590 [Petrolisthes cinctipes]